MGYTLPHPMDRFLLLMNYIFSTYWLAVKEQIKAPDLNDTGQFSTSHILPGYFSLLYMDEIDEDIILKDKTDDPTNLWDYWKTGEMD